MVWYLRMEKGEGELQEWVAVDVEERVQECDMHLFCLLKLIEPLKC